MERLNSETLSNKEKFEILRNKYPVFTYKSYNYKIKENYLEISFEFEAGRHRFSPRSRVLLREFLRDDILDSLDVFVFNIGMIEMISYWKSIASKEIRIECGSLGEKEIKFWTKLYYNGLGEYFYLNGIDTDIDSFVKISSSGRRYVKPLLNLDENVVILPIGGGKDSVVSIEALRGSELRVVPLIINPRGASIKSIKRGGMSIQDSIIIEREIDPYLIELNQKGYLNGHTPFSAMLAFYTVLSAKLLDGRHIALSNESSANESTVIGEDINHQYSKSLEFENDFREYTKEFVCEEVNYFSLLRPFSELQIAERFSQYTHYHDVFKSCNQGSKTDSWCCNCSKCLFAYIILSPFILPNKLMDIFGENLLDKPSLNQDFNKLIGRDDQKPFECVGTIEEVNLAIELALNNHSEIKEYKLIQGWKDVESIISPKEFLKQLDPNHNLEPRFWELIPKPYLFQKLSLIYNELLDKEILILGFGREGRASYSFLRKLFPYKSLSVADIRGDIEVNDPNLSLLIGNAYPKNLNEFDVILKSPGVDLISHKVDKHRISSQTNIFLRLFQDQIIGISGTKGKSTTTTLIYNAISSVNNNVVIGGNIGIPVLDLINRIEEDTIIVMEISAHQLEGLKYPPYVSVLLNLFEEHLDYFQTLERYYAAKLSLANPPRQKPGYLIYNKDNKTLKDLIEMGETQREKIGIGIEDYNLPDPKYLLGNNNKLNTLFAAKVLELIGLLNPRSQDALLSFKGLEHRQEYVLEKNNIRFYNDSISTIPEATLSAMDSIPSVQTLILGGMDRGINYDILSRLGEYSELRNIALIGEAGRRIRTILEDGCGESRFEIYYSDNFSELINWAAESTSPYKSCLLSPAAPSFDQFKDFEERGNRFKEFVFAFCL